MQTDAIYFDGEVAADRRVVLSLAPDGLRIVGEDIAEQHWPLTSLTAIGRYHAGHPLRISSEHRPTARLVIADPEFASRLLSQSPQLRGGLQPHRLRRAAIWVAAGLAVLFAGLYLVLNFAPQRLAQVLPDSWRERVGQQVEASLTNGARECRTAAAAAALSSLVSRLAEGTPDMPPVTVRVYDMPVMNAFAMSGNRIVVTSGLIARAETPDQVAGVLAHELGHVVYRHPEAQIIRATGLQVLISAVTGGNSETLGSVAGLAAILRYSRSAEEEADDYALAVLRAAQLDPMALRRFFELVLRQEGTPSTGAFGKIESVLATHPGTKERIKKIEPLPEGVLTRPALSKDQWQALKAICSG